MVAHAQAHESKKDPGAFVNPKDIAEERAFLGSFSGYERNVFYEKQGARWVEVGYALGLDFDHDGRAVAPLDVDGDGDLDLALLSLQGLKLLRNEAAPRNWLRVRLKATRSEPHALGARVTVAAGALKTLDRVRLTGGFHAQTSTELHFGLGEAATAAITVQWPSGATQVFEGLTANRRYLLTEGGSAAPVGLPAWPPDAQPRVGRYDLTAPVETATGARAPLTEAKTPQVINFWAPWCTACEREVPALARLAQAGVAVTGISVEVKDRAGVAAFAQAHGLTYRNRFATDAVIESFFGPEGKMTLPATFVFDAHGRLRRSFFREVRPDEIQAALQEEPGTARDAWMLAELQVKVNNPGGALALLKRAEALADGDAAALHEIARVLLSLGRLADARRIVETGLEQAGSDPELLLLKGQIRARGGEMAAAEAAVDAALAVTPGHRDALINKAMLLRARGALAEAEAHFEQALRVDPRSAVARQALADLRAQAR